MRGFAMRPVDMSTAAWMCSRQAPQPVPARVQREISSTLSAPSAIALAMARSDTDLQTQMIIEAALEIEYNFQYRLTQVENNFQ
jgi:hypothetical protein